MVTNSSSPSTAQRPCEGSYDADFFKPLHVEHREYMPAAVAHLCLPPGWRFLLAPGYEDVWADSTLLDVASDSN